KNDREIYKNLGVVGKTPRGLVAWKFPAEEATTVVENVEWFVGRTGALTPVALVRPTNIGGTMVKHASLHNIDEIERLGLKIGDTVVLVKAGDIIPKVLRVLKEMRGEGASGASGAAREIRAPRACPVCGSDTVRRKGEVALYCSNDDCPAKDQGRVLYAARAFEIDWLGDEVVTKLLEAGLIHSAPDLFALKPEDLLELEGFADRSATLLLESIAGSKTVSLDRFLMGLGIRQVGQHIAKVLAREFGSLEEIMSADRRSCRRIGNGFNRFVRLVLKFPRAWWSIGLSRTTGRSSHSSRNPAYRLHRAWQRATGGNPRLQGRRSCLPVD
ncbi:MAG: ligA, partial [Bacteroidetes bacterium]|nr:ligA [Bacteroidota bacterium]